MRLVLVKFYDHSWGSGLGLKICTVFGELCEDLSDTVCLSVRVWKSEAEDAVYDPHDGNQEYANILRDAVIEMSILREVAGESDEIGVTEAEA